MLLFFLLLLGCNMPVQPPATATAAATVTASPTFTPLPSPTATFLPPTPRLIWTPLPGVNVALKKHVKVSRESYGHGGAAAVDGNPRTQWNSGAGPTQWIEVDLGAAYDITQIHLLPGIFRPGVTVHRILGKGPFTGGFQALYTFESQTSDSPLLASATPSPWAGIRVVRIETTFSAAPIGWREIEIIATQ